MTSQIIRLPYQPYTIIDPIEKCYTCLYEVTDPAVGHAHTAGPIIHPQHYTCAQESLEAGYDECGVCRTPLDPESLGYAQLRVLHAKRERNETIENEIVFERYVELYDDIVSAPIYITNSRFIDHWELLKQVGISVIAWTVLCAGSKTPEDHLISTSVMLGGVDGWRNRGIEMFLTAGIVYAVTTSKTALFPTQDWLTNITLSATSFSLAVAFSPAWSTGTRIAAIAIALIVNLSDMYLQHNDSISDLTGVAIISFMAGSALVRIIPNL